MVAGDKPLHSSSTPWQHKRPDHIGLRSFTHPYRDRTLLRPYSLRDQLWRSSVTGHIVGSDEKFKLLKTTA